MDVKEMMGAEWHRVLKDELEAPYMSQLGQKLISRTNFVPGWNNLFAAFKLTPPSSVKIVILGQDPYPIPGDAHGLAFSVEHGGVPYSLKQIFKDLELSYGTSPKSGNLTGWAKQGVLLLNTCLSTEPRVAYAHKGWGWELFTAHVLRQMDRMPQFIQVMAWGKAAQDVVSKNILKHPVLKAAHPANERYNPGSFIGSKHFEYANQALVGRNLEPINWLATGI